MGVEGGGDWKGREREGGGAMDMRGKKRGGEGGGEGSEGRSSREVFEPNYI